jgi:phosphohistidine phosphatase
VTDFLARKAGSPERHGRENAPVPLLLDVLRHGEAEPAGTRGDAGRALTSAGRRAIAELTANLAQEGWRPDRILSSPLLRARQTAEIVRAGTPGAPDIEETDDLLAETEPSDTIAALHAASATMGRVLLITHQPLAGRLAALLTGDAPGFTPGTLVSIECAAGLKPGHGRVVRAIEPRTAQR